MFFITSVVILENGGKHRKILRKDIVQHWTVIVNTIFCIVIYGTGYYNKDCTPWGATPTAYHG